MTNFSELPLSPVLQANLAQNKLTIPTPVQARAIPPQLEGRDVVVTAQTGTGKTLAFLLPLLERLLQVKSSQPDSAGKHHPQQNVQALILSPTRELAQQIDEAFRTLAPGTGIRSAVVTGGANEQRQLLAIRQGAQVVIATPGRLHDFLQRKLVKLQTTRFLILDEADRMLDMGFLPVIQQILALLPTDRQTMFFSATMEPAAAQLVKNYLREPVRIEIGTAGRPADHVDLRLYEVDADRKLSLLEKMLSDEEGSFLVFAKTKHGADRLADKLVRGGAKAARIHGNRTQSQRNQALRGFQQGDYRVLVATDVAARGIHVEGIAHVVNFDLPQVPEDFVHRVGRTGRAGVRGTASTFGLKSERGVIARIERLMGVRLQRHAVAADVVRDSQREPRMASAPEPKREVKPFYESAPIGQKAREESRNRHTGEHRPSKHDFGGKDDLVRAYIETHREERGERKVQQSHPKPAHGSKVRPGSRFASSLTQRDFEDRPASRDAEPPKRFKAKRPFGVKAKSASQPAPSAKRSAGKPFQSSRKPQGAKAWKSGAPARKFKSSAPAGRGR